MDILDAIWSWASSSVMYANVLAVAVASTTILAARSIYIQKTSLKDHLESGITRGNRRTLRKVKSENVPAYLRVADLNNIYVQRAARVATAIRGAVENNGQQLLRLWSIPFHREAIKNHLDKKNGLSVAEKIVAANNGYRDLATRSGIPVKGGSLLHGPGSHNTRVKM
mgnify:CR=1 FL=1